MELTIKHNIVAGIEKYMREIGFKSYSDGSCDFMLLKYMPDDEVDTTEHYFDTLNDYAWYNHGFELVRSKPKSWFNGTKIFILSHHSSNRIGDKFVECHINIFVIICDVTDSEGVEFYDRH